MNGVTDNPQRASFLVRAGAVLAGAAWFAVLGTVLADRLISTGIALFVAVGGWILLGAVVLLGVATAGAAVRSARAARGESERRYAIARALVASWIVWAVGTVVLLMSLGS